MTPDLRPALLIGLLATLTGKAAGAPDETPADTIAAPSVQAATAPLVPASKSGDWDGALGLTGALRPQYPGSPRRVFRATPGFYFRYGRFTVTNASGFAPRRGEDVVRGLGVELIESDRFRASLSLRYDSGRSEHGSPAYMGLGNIPHTLRARAAVSWQIGGPWRAGASWNADALGRGVGGVGDVSAGWERRLTPDTLLSLNSALSFGDQRYMQSYYGITDAQALRSEYLAYTARAGLRDISAAANLRHDIGHDWTLLAGAGATRLLGAAADSPITHERRGFSLTAGVARQF